MCLYAKPGIPDDHPDEVICYKILTSDNKSPFFTGYMWKPGEMRSSRASIKNDYYDICWGEKTEYNRGIHVYRQYPKEVLSCYKVIEVRCRKEDFVACDDEEAVYMKVYWDA